MKSDSYLIQSNNWSILEGQYLIHSDSVHLFARLDAANVWHFDSSGVLLELPGHADFEFALCLSSGRFSIRSPFRFHWEDFSVWVDHSIPIQYLSHIESEHSYWVLEAFIDPEFLDFVCSDSGTFNFRLSFFQD